MPNIKRGMMGAAGADTGCADCGLFAWGYNSVGQLGTGDTANLSSPVQVYAAVPTDFSAGNQFSAVIKTNGSLWTTGLNDNGQLGHGNTTNLSAFTQVGSDTDWDQISCGDDHWIARKTGGTVWTCGSGYRGFLGNDSTANVSTAVQVGSDTDWTTVMTSGVSVSAFKGTSLYGWGAGYAGSLGNNAGVDYSSPVLIGTGYANGVRSSHGSNQYLNNQIKTDNTIWVAGYGYRGSGGTGASGNPYYNTYTQIGSAQWTWVCFGRYNNMARRTDGTLYAWGWNNGGNLGTGNTTSYSSPVLVTGGETWGADFRHGGKGDYSSAAINTSGELFGWGNGGYGALGLGNETDYSAPQQIGSATDWTAIDRGPQHALGVITG